MPNEDISNPAGTPSFVAVDWGTSSFRLWVMDVHAHVLASAHGPYGMAGLAQDEFGHVLEKELDKLRVAHDVPVVICGMAGAAQGWCEAPYVSVPTALSHLSEHAVCVADSERRVHILPGVKQMHPGNVMRGEETQILGLLLQKPDYSGVVCLPGTHSKWVELRAGSIEQFTTCMTGELFSLLSEQSVLKHATTGGGWESCAFKEGVQQILQAPAELARELFRLRADTLLADQSSAAATARLSGMLIGFELAATRTFWGARDVALIGEAQLCEKYLDALAMQSISAHILDNQAMTLAGLVSAFKQL